MARRKKITGIDPDYLEKQRLALLRRNRQVIYLNDREMAAIEEYRSRFGIKTARSALLREIMMERILSDLEESHPTLF